MSDESITTQIYKNLLFPKIFQTFRISIQPPKITIAFLAIIIIFLTGWLMDFSNSVASSAVGDHKISELDIFLSTPEQLPDFIQSFNNPLLKQGVFETLWDFATKNFNNIIDSLFALNFSEIGKHLGLYFKAATWAFRYHSIYCTIFFAVKLVVLAIAGGAICRIAALQFAKREKPGLTEALSYSFKNFKKYFTAPLFPIIIILFFGFWIFIFGLIGKIPWDIGELLLGIFMPLALFIGFLITFFSIGTIVGFSLMFPAVAYECSDCLDSMERSFSYIFKKPWNMGLYSVISFIYGSICYTFIRLFTFLLLFISHQFLLLGYSAGSPGKALNFNQIWPEPTFVNLLGPTSCESMSFLACAGVFIARLTILAVLGLLVSYLISFYFSAISIIYALMRKLVDKTPLTEIYYSNDN